MDQSLSSLLWVCAAPAAAIFCWVFAIANTAALTLPSMGGSARAKKQELLRTSLFFRLAYPIIQAFARMIALFRPRQEDDPLVRKLIWAGQPGGLCPEEFLACGVFGAVLMPILARLAMMFYVEDFGVLSILAFAAFGAVYPHVWLGEAIKSRRASIVRSLPFVLDNLTMSMEAGLDFGAAVERLLARGRRKRSPLEEELATVLQEVRMGKTRAEALLALSERVESPDVRSFVGAVVQGERLGTPLAQILRVQAEALRTKRFQRAEKLAGEAPVKILFPLLFVMAAVILTVFGGTIVRAMKGELL